MGAHRDRIARPPGRRTVLRSGRRAGTGLPVAAAVGCAGGGGGAPEPAAPAPAWGYGGAIGPERWASLSPEYADCSEGERQSPIDIAGYAAGGGGPIAFAYRGAAAAVRCDGTFVHADFAPGSAIDVGGRVYGLETAHLHAPSEHRIGGAGFEAELHLVHAGEGGALAVVAVLFAPGAPDPAIRALLAAAPPAGGTAPGAGPDAGALAPPGAGYFRYDGAKTTPPCREGVVWFVMSEPRTIAPEQAGALRALAGGPNSRPGQPLRGRAIVAVGVP